MLPKQPTTGWYKFRIAMLPLFFVGGIASATLNQQLAPADAFFTLPLLIAFSIFGVIAMPFMLAAVISFQALNPWSDAHWSPPRHDDNPFHLGNPLRFFHFAAFQIPAAGLGMTVAAIWTRVDFFVMGILTMLGGLSTLAGVHLAMRLCKQQLQPAPKAT